MYVCSPGCQSVSQSVTYLMRLFLIVPINESMSDVDLYVRNLSRIMEKILWFIEENDLRRVVDIVNRDIVNRDKREVAQR